MKSLSAWGKAGVVLLVLNEIRGVLVVLSVISAWSHASKAQPPPAVSAEARPAPSSMLRPAPPAPMPLVRTAP
jgi:hypothetical protein